MSQIFPIEPVDGWKAGDLAFCVNPTRSHFTTPPLEKGRVYRVATAWKPRGIAHHGLSLEGVDTGEAEGFWSNRFVKLRPLPGRLQRLTSDTERTCAHYWARALASEEKG